VKRVFTASNIPEAYFVRGLLESHGLNVVVRGEHLWGTRGEVPIPETWPSLWVLDDALEARALEVVREYESGRASSGPQGLTWRCPRCGQQLEPQFTSCWQCGVERPL
jgi:hypothetical protein